MHGPIPMKVESCRADMLRVCLSPAQLLRLGSVQSKVVGLKAFGRRTHEDEWDEVRIKCSARVHAIRLTLPLHGHAYVSAIVAVVCNISSRYLLYIVATYRRGLDHLTVVKQYVECCTAGEVSRIRAVIR